MRPSFVPTRSVYVWLACSVCVCVCVYMFCFTYEYDFISRIIAAGRKDLISHFRHTLRFVDDLISVKNPVFEEYLYTSQTDASGIAGIYPPF